MADSVPLSPPTYRQRLRREGAALTACGVAGSVLLLTLTAQATHGPASTGGQLLIVAGLLLWFGPRGVRRSIADSDARTADTVGSGEPTPLWHILAIVISLTLIAGEVAGWDAGLRVTAGCALVGACQGLILAPMVARRERASSVTYYRVAGSRILRGTKLGHSAH